MQAILPKETQSKRKLSARQASFCAEYVKDFNGAGAARRAGYSEKSESAKRIASKLLTLGHIQHAIQVRKTKMATRQRYTVEQIIEALWQNYEIALKLKKVADSNRALELIGKHLGAFSEKIEFSGHLEVEGRAKTPEERLLWLKEQARLLEAAQGAGTALAIEP